MAVFRKKEIGISELEKQDLARSLARIHGFSNGAGYNKVKETKIRQQPVKVERRELDNLRFVRI